MTPTLHAGSPSITLRANSTSEENSFSGGYSPNWHRGTHSPLPVQLRVPTSFFCMRLPISNL